jgi:hypothetical protein
MVVATAAAQAVAEAAHPTKAVQTQAVATKATKVDQLVNPTR